MNVGGRDACRDAVTCFGGGGARGLPAHREPGAKGASDSGEDSHGDWDYWEQGRGGFGRVGIAAGRGGVHSGQQTLQIGEPGREGRRQRIANSYAFGGSDCRRGQGGAGGWAVRGGKRRTGI